MYHSQHDYIYSVRYYKRKALMAQS